MAVISWEHPMVFFLCGELLNNVLMHEMRLEIGGSIRRKASTVTTHPPVYQPTLWEQAFKLVDRRNGVIIEIIVKMYPPA